MTIRTELKGIQPLEESTKQNVLDSRSLTGTSVEDINRFRQELALRERPGKEVTVKRGQEASEQLLQEQQVHYSVSKSGPSLSSPIPNHTGIEHLTDIEVRVNGPYGGPVVSPIGGTVVGKGFKFGVGPTLEVASLDGSTSVSIGGIRGGMIPGTAIQQGDAVGHQCVKSGVTLTMAENGVPTNPAKYLKA